jgi:hypothetical protein
LVLLDLDRRKGSATVVVSASHARRAVLVSNGQLVGCESNIKSERVGDMLVSEGLLDAVLLEPVAAEAAKKGVRLGDQMVADGLLNSEELHRALEPVGQREARGDELLAQRRARGSGGS